MTTYNYPTIHTQKDSCGVFDSLYTYECINIENFKINLLYKESLVSYEHEFRSQSPNNYNDYLLRDLKKREREIKREVRNGTLCVTREPIHNGYILHYKRI